MEFREPLLFKMGSGQLSTSECLNVFEETSSQKVSLPLEDFLQLLNTKRWSCNVFLVLKLGASCNFW